MRIFDDKAFLSTSHVVLVHLLSSLHNSIVYVSLQRLKNRSSSGKLSLHDFLSLL